MPISDGGSWTTRGACTFDEPPLDVHRDRLQIQYDDQAAMLERENDDVLHDRAETVVLALSRIGQERAMDLPEARAELPNEECAGTQEQS